MIWTFATPKGGVGKSTLTLLTATMLRELFGSNVAIVDADAQASTTKNNSRLDSPFMVTREVVIDRLFERLPDLDARYDFVLVDGPGANADITRTLLSCSELAIFPLQPSVQDIEAMNDCLEIIDQARELREDSGLPLAVIVPNRVKASTSVAKERQLQAYGDAVGVHTLSTGLADRIAYQVSLGGGTPLWELPGKGPEVATEECKEVILELLTYAQENYPYGPGSQGPNRTPEVVGEHGEAEDSRARSESGSQRA